jgi:hypothetical protein
MIKVQTKNGVELFISLCDDCGENKGGYFCQVYLDKDGSEDYDNFIIHKKDLDCFENEDECIQKHCEDYAKSFDDAPILNKKFNKIYDLISEVNELVNEFYMRHIVFNKNCSDKEKTDMVDLWDKMGWVKEQAHFIAEHYTWDY